MKRGENGLAEDQNRIRGTEIISGEKQGDSGQILGICFKRVVIV